MSAKFSTTQTALAVAAPAPDKVVVNGEAVANSGYLAYHRQRIAATMEAMGRIGASRVVELGAHPWAMTALLVDDPRFEILATVSAEEVTNWPDDIAVGARTCDITTARGNRARFINYSANLERTLFYIEERPDTIAACEIIEHMIRSPHIMLLNINHWLPIGGNLILTTPNGAQFSNPFRRKSHSPAYRCNAYERHAFLYTRKELVDIISLCGFHVIESGYWDVYTRSGPGFLLDAVSGLPGIYFKDKFKKTIYCIARKSDDIQTLSRPPLIYDPRGKWEFIEPRS